MNTEKPRPGWARKRARNDVVLDVAFLDELGFKGIACRSLYVEEGINTGNVEEEGPGHKSAADHPPCLSHGCRSAEAEA